MVGRKFHVSRRSPVRFTLNACRRGRTRNTGSSGSRLFLMLRNPKAFVRVKTLSRQSATLVYCRRSSRKCSTTKRCAGRMWPPFMRIWPPRMPWPQRRSCSTARIVRARSRGQNHPGWRKILTFPGRKKALGESGGFQPVSGETYRFHLSHAKASTLGRTAVQPILKICRLERIR